MLTLKVGRLAFFIVNNKYDDEKYTDDRRTKGNFQQ